MKQQQVDEQMTFLYGIPFGIICLMVLIIDFLVYMRRHHHPALENPKRHNRQTLISPNISEDDLVDIPISATTVTTLMNFIAFPIVMCIISNADNPSDNFAYVYIAYTTTVLILNIPIAVFLSIDSNDVNLSRERQRKNIKAWNSVAAKFPQQNFSSDL